MVVIIKKEFEQIIEKYSLIDEDFKNTLISIPNEQISILEAGDKIYLKLDKINANKIKEQLTDDIINELNSRNEKDYSGEEIVYIKLIEWANKYAKFVDNLRLEDIVPSLILLDLDEQEIKNYYINKYKEELIGILGSKYKERVNHLNELHEKLLIENQEKTCLLEYIFKNTRSNEGWTILDCAVYLEDKELIDLITNKFKIVK